MLGFLSRGHPKTTDIGRRKDWHVTCVPFVKKSLAGGAQLCSTKQWIMFARKLYWSSVSIIIKI